MNPAVGRNLDGYSEQDGWACTVADPEWHAKNKYTFGSISIQCEGYAHDNDHNILKESCYLEYTLEKRNNSGKNFGKQEL